jgi:hypothetical protein
MTARITTDSIKQSSKKGKVNETGKKNIGSEKSKMIAEDKNHVVARTIATLENRRQKESSLVQVKTKKLIQKKKETSSTILLPEEKEEMYALAVANDIEEVVARAVSFVTAEISTGVWSYKGNLDTAEGGNKTDDESSLLPIKERSRLNEVSLALENFAIDIIIPNLVASGVAEASCGSKKAEDIVTFRKKRDTRVFISVLLNLREVLILNAGIFFPKNGSMKDDDSIVKVYLLSTSLIFAAMTRIEPENKRKQYSDQFKDAMIKYDNAHEEFASCLKRVDCSSIGVTPTGKIITREENIAWRVSHNFSRESHPLIKKRKLTDGNVVPPGANAAYVSVLEHQPLNSQAVYRNKIEDESYILKKHRELMNNCKKGHNIL